MRNIVNKLARELLVRLLVFLPRERRVAFERRWRGREELRKLRLCDAVIVSFGKSGRTWLRVLLSRFFQVRFGLSERHLIGFDNLHRKNRSIPRLFFTHDNYLRDYTGHRSDKSDYYDRKVVLLVRHPCDIAVSQYFQWKFRMRPAKKVLNDYPAGDGELSVFDFVMDGKAGLTKVIDFLNGWAAELPRLNEVLVVRYEDMRADPDAVLDRILRFLGFEPSAGELAESVAFASVENMRAMEQRKIFWLSGGRMTPRDRSNPHSYKVRRAKVGGYRDYFDDAQLAAIDALVAERLLPAFGYAATAGAAPEDAAPGTAAAKERAARA